MIKLALMSPTTEGAPMSDVTIKVELTFHHISGGTLQASNGLPVEDFVLDAFAATVGKQNGAKRPLRVTVIDNDDNEATFELGLVDDVDNA
jgi:hypothetical protein